MTYEEKISSLLHAHLTFDEPGSLPDLARALGCCNHRYTRKWVTDVPPQPNPVYEPLILQTLLTALRYHAGARNDDSNGESILNGLLRNNRWRACLESLDDAYKFVAVVACFYANFESGILNNNKNDLQSHNIEPLKKVIVEWLGVSAAESEKMTKMLFLRQTFGNLWCEFALSENMPLWDILPIISAVRPPFVTGLLPAQLETAAQTLPCLEAP
jgi:hypothetical protein